MQNMNTSVESPYNAMAGRKMKEYELNYHNSLERLVGRTIQIMVNHTKGAMFSQSMSQEAEFQGNYQVIQSILQEDFRIQNQILLFLKLCLIKLRLLRNQKFLDTKNPRLGQVMSIKEIVTLD